MVGKNGLQPRDAFIFPMNKCSALDHSSFILNNCDLERNDDSDSQQLHIKLKIIAAGHKAIVNSYRRMVSRAFTLRQRQ